MLNNQTDHTSFLVTLATSVKAFASNCQGFVVNQAAALTIPTSQRPVPYLIPSISMMPPNTRDLVGCQVPSSISSFSCPLPYRSLWPWSSTLGESRGSINSPIYRPTSYPTSPEHDSRHNHGLVPVLLAGVEVARVEAEIDMLGKGAATFAGRSSLASRVLGPLAQAN